MTSSSSGVLSTRPRGRRLGQHPTPANCLTRPDSPRGKPNGAWAVTARLAAQNPKGKHTMSTVQPSLFQVTT